MRSSSLFVIGSIVSVAAVIVYAILDYQNRVYEYRYLPSKCVVGSSCPFPAVNDGLIWLGIVIIVVGIVLILFRKMQLWRGKK